MVSDLENDKKDEFKYHRNRYGRKWKDEKDDDHKKSKNAIRKDGH